jgi:SNF2 family DNA or RNA helicase
MDWCAATNNQAEDRCHRIGQKNNVNIWYLISKGTIEEHILNITNTKRKLFDKVYNSELTLEDNQNILDNTSLIDEIILEIERKKEDSVLQRTG